MNDGIKGAWPPHLRTALPKSTTAPRYSLSCGVITSD